METFIFLNSHSSIGEFLGIIKEYGFFGFF